MSNERKDPQPEKNSNQIGQGLAIGIAIGLSLGVAFHNIPIGVALGVMLGAAIGASLSQKNKKRIELSMQQTYLRNANAIHPIPLSAYLLLTFGSAWLIWSPLLVAEYLHLTLPVPSLVFIMLGAFAPTITALFLTWKYAGGTELRRLLSRALIWRVSPIWYLFVIVGPALIMLLAMGIHALLGGTAPDYVPFGVRWLIVAVNFILILLIGGPLGEEFGWRGFALPSLEAHFSPLWASLILGVIWAVWHLPLFFISGSAQHNLPFGMYALLTIPLTLLITWVYHGSGDSLLLVMLFHAAVNTWSGSLMISPEAAGSTRPLVFVVVLTWGLALLVVGFKVLRIPKGSREQVSEVGESSI